VERRKEQEGGEEKGETKQMAASAERESRSARTRGKNGRQYNQNEKTVVGQKRSLGDRFNRRYAR